MCKLNQSSQGAECLLEMTNEPPLSPLTPQSPMLPVPRMTMHVAHSSAGVNLAFTCQRTPARMLPFGLLYFGEGGLGWGVKSEKCVPACWRSRGKIKKIRDVWDGKLKE